MQFDCQQGVEAVATPSAQTSCGGVSLFLGKPFTYRQPPQSIGKLRYVVSILQPPLPLERKSADTEVGTGNGPRH